MYKHHLHLLLFLQLPLRNDHLREDAFNKIRIQSGIDLLFSNNKLQDLNILFNSQNLSAMNSLGKLIKNAFETREA